MSQGIDSWPDEINGHFEMPGVVADIDAVRGLYASVYSWTGDGTGRTREALRQLRLYGAGHLDVHDPGQPGEASRSYWEHMVAEGLIDELFDADGQAIPRTTSVCLMTPELPPDTTMPSSSYVPDQLRIDILKDAMTKLAADPSKLPTGYHSATVEPGVAMLVEPVNAPTFVFVQPGVVHLFEHEAGSGTDKLRQRMRASVFFNQLVERTRANAAAAAPTRDRVAPR